MLKVACMCVMLKVTYRCVNEVKGSLQVCVCLMLKVCVCHRYVCV